MNKKIKIALIQTSIKWEETKNNLSKYESIVKQISNANKKY